MKSSKVVALLVGSIAIAFGVYWITARDSSNAMRPNSPAEYFEYGSIGADIVPLPVFEVLPDMFPQHFRPGGDSAGDWVEQFGFIRRDCANANKEYCLPVGFTVTDHAPKSGKHSLIPYVGLTCALCHVGELRAPNMDRGKLVAGMGNASLDLVAFGDAVKSAVLDENFTVGRINAKYREKYQRSLSLVDQGLIQLWLWGIRKDIRDKMPIFGAPFGGTELRDAHNFPSGPGRIMAVRDAVIRLKNEMPYPNGGPSKLPSLYEQGRRDWAQFDGSVQNPLTRNAIAALGVGATAKNLRVPDILATIRNAYAFVKDLRGPKFHETFPDAPTSENRAGKGARVYQEHCASCHGAPGENGEWLRAERLGVPIDYREIGTDAERVTPKYYDKLKDLLYAEYPAGHPLQPQPRELRATHGFITTPLESVFSRAPYLHNGSIATLAELINLKPRRNVFYRGREFFDTANVGLLVSETMDAQHYYRYDASVPGNSNKGHDYPWSYRGNGWNEDELKDLLEYLKTL